MQPVSFPAFNAFRSAAMAGGATAAADHGRAITATSISETTRHNRIMRASWIGSAKCASIIGMTTTSRMCVNPYGADGFDHLFAARERERINLTTTIPSLLVLAEMMYGHSRSAAVSWEGATNLVDAPMPIEMANENWCFAMRKNKLEHP
eukprot:scaffold2026_cov78-Cylindrotheca_fusiformis.AAC.10